MSELEYICICSKILYYIWKYAYFRNNTVKEYIINFFSPWKFSIVNKKGGVAFSSILYFQFLLSPICIYILNISWEILLL